MKILKLNKLKNHERLFLSTTLLIPNISLTLINTSIYTDFNPFLKPFSDNNNFLKTKKDTKIITFDIL